MSDDVKSQLIWATVIVLCIGIICGSITYYNSATELANINLQITALEQGCVQGSIAGQQGVYWIKPDNRFLPK